MCILIVVEILRKMIERPKIEKCECEAFCCVGTTNSPEIPKIPWVIMARQPDRSDARLSLASMEDCPIRKNGKGPTSLG